ncbi:MAG: hypothetical protein RR092_06455 [Oscillospiraceae bacterium]
MFTNPHRKRLFSSLLFLSVAGLFLPWFSFDPKMSGYFWGWYSLVLTFVPLCAVFGLCYGNPRPERWPKVLVETLLLSVPVCEFGYFLTWYTFTVMPFQWSVSLRVATPAFWIALFLALLPPLAFPLCVDWRRSHIN